MITTTLSNPMASNPRFFTQQALSSQRHCELESDVSHHLAKVLRMKVGDSLCLFNNSGNEYQAEVIDISKQTVTVNILSEEPINKESPLNIHLAIAVSKGDRMDFVIQKATELGVTTINSERTNVKLKSERLDKKQQHWQKVAISACEQCGRNIIPAIFQLTDLNSWLESCNAEQKFVLHHRTHKKLEEIDPPESVALLIGPEGGLSAEEITLAESNGFQPLALGPRVLRTETAPLAAISLLQFCWGDL